MSKKLFTLISSLVGAAATVATALVTYFQPEAATAIVASIGVATVAINDILLKFVETEPTKQVENQ